MLRITKTLEDHKTVTLRLDGKVVRTTLFELAKLCLQYRDNDNKAVVLDFSGVTFIDESGLSMLKTIKDKRVNMVNASLFIEMLLSGLKE